MSELTIEAKTENLDKVLEFVDSILEEQDCPPKVQMQIDVAVEEIFVNIAHYAYKAEVGMATITIKTLNDPVAVEITFADSGIPFDPLMKPDPDVTQSADERQIGGLGIYMVKKSMDDVRYEYHEGKNIFTIVKNLA